LKREGHHPRLKIIGSGKEDGTLRALVARLGLQSQVSFLGAQTGEVLVELLNAHSVIAIPSVWREPFGLVALEGLACGCIPVAADGGGLQEAIGECGLTFSRGSSKALAEALGCALYNPYIGERVRMRSTAHLARHERGSIALRYHEIFSQAIAQQSTKTAMATRR
jgi:glycosyltransferase involved in cell wall biosynthesis